MMNHRDMKARLWVYFTRVLQDPTHPRWREYIRFQHRSIQSKEDYGQLSILRSLHCNQKEHGLACNVSPPIATDSAVYPTAYNERADQSGSLPYLTTSSLSWLIISELKL